MPTVDLDSITVGSRYRNNIITKIDEEVKDLKNGKVKIRKLITLDDGMIVIEDALFDFEEIKGDYKELQYNEIEFQSPTSTKKKSSSKKKKKDKDDSLSPKKKIPPPAISDDDDDEEQRKREAEEKARLEAEEAARLEAEERARREAEERARQEEEERKRRQAEEEEAERLRKSQEEMERRKKEADEARRIKQLRDNWTPQKMWAYTDHNDDTAKPTRANWKIPDGKEDDYDTKKWPAKEVTLYPPNKSLPSSIRNAKDAPRGYYYYSDKALQPGDKDTEWIPQDNPTSKAPFVVLLPGEEPPRDRDLIVGEWCMEPPEVWPPLKEPKSYTVHPPNSNPEPSEDEYNDNGVWTVGDGFPDIDESDWNLAQVLAYDEGHEPKDLDPSKPQGPWGVAPGAKPNANGVYDPSDTWFILPGEEVPGDGEWDCKGTWILDSDDGWPPYKEPPIKMVVNHQDNVDSTTSPDEVDKGVWIRHPDVKAEDWIPSQVLAYKDGHEPDNIDPKTPQGLWGLALDAVPDANGNFSPKDILYVFPGEEPPKDDEWDRQGPWVLDSDDWPPYNETPPEPKKFTVGHGPQMGANPDNFPCWHIGDGYPDCDDDAWGLTEVLAYEDGAEPENLASKPHGKWGTAPDAKPDENGIYDPNDLWFIYPGDDEPDSNEWNCCGQWALDDSAGDQQWPPYKESPKRPGPSDSISREESDERRDRGW